MNSIYIKTPGRLHLGQIDLNGSLGRIYGGMGVAIDRPNFIMKMEKASEIRVDGPRAQKVKAIVFDYLDKLKQSGVLIGEIKFKIEIEEIIPAHVGFGSSTQIGLGIGFAINKLFNLELSMKEIATLVDRKKSRSSIGYGAFKDGGFIIDGGRPLAEKENDSFLPPIIVQHDLPEEWRFILVLPKSNTKGLSGQQEVEAFREIPPMNQQKVQKNSRLILLQILPSLVEDDIESFGEALTEVQQNVGDYFEQVQGGRYAASVSQKIVDKLIEWGGYGVGQSSWGPLLYGLVEGEEEAIKIKNKVIDYFKSDIEWIDIAKVNNQGLIWE